jgi:hypothetical protein
MDGDFTPRIGLAGHPSASKAIGRKLKVARNQLEASEDFVAAALGLTVEDYRSVESGTAQLSPGRVIQAAQLFGLQPSVLCIQSDSDGGKDEVRPKPGTPASVIDLGAVRTHRKG